MKMVPASRLDSDKGISYTDRHRRRLEAAGKFPKRVKLSACSTAYVESEIDDWIKARIAARDDTAKTEAADAAR